jgi:hypothetical protein
VSIIALAELEVPAPLSQVFAHFIDFSSWSAWMPALFTPISGPQRALREGDKFKVRIGRLPVSLEVARFRPEAEFGWQGGSPWVIQGIHTFKFEAVGSKTRIRSEETLSGLLALRVMSAKLSRQAAAEATHLMKGFANHLAQR